MIFVILGTQPNGFFRYLNELENLIEQNYITEEVVAQIGDTKFETTKFKTIRFIGENEIKKYINNASVVITHASSGAIFNSIKAGKKVIGLANLDDNNEIIDNYQTELIKKLAECNYILDGTYSLFEVWSKLDSFMTKENVFVDTIVDIVDKYLSDVLNE